MSKLMTSISLFLFACIMLRTAQSCKTFRIKKRNEILQQNIKQEIGTITSKIVLKLSTLKLVVPFLERLGPDAFKLALADKQFRKLEVTRKFSYFPNDSSVNVFWDVELNKFIW